MKHTNLTILIPTSPIPSHPSTDIIDETIHNIRQYTDAKIIIMVDGIHPSLEHRRDDYKKYYMNLLERADSGAYGECWLHSFPEHNHQSMMTRYVLNNIVKTDLVMFCEHDTSPIGDIPFDGLCEFVRSSATINQLRFNIFHEILEEHQYLMIDKEPKVWKTEHGEFRIVRTMQWSQRPHIAKTLWYKNIIEIYFPEKRSMIEDVMHSVVIEDNKLRGHDIFGLAIYAPEGNQLRSYHSDGRKTDEKIIEA
jgi:hypothetical protein